MNKQIQHLALQARLTAEQLRQYIHADITTEELTQAHLDLLKLRIEQSLNTRPTSLDALLTRYNASKAYIYPDGAVGIRQAGTRGIRHTSHFHYFQWFKWSSHSGGFIPRNKYPRWSIPPTCTVYELTPSTKTHRPPATVDQVQATMQGSNICPPKRGRPVGYKVPEPNSTPELFEHILQHALRTHLQGLRVTKNQKLASDSETD